MSDETAIKERFAQILWSAFANSEYFDEQSEEVFWAITEGAYRTGLLPILYSTPKARKEHTCIRGCKISINSQYFKSMGAFSPIRICARCMAMILYFGNVWNLPVYQWDRWNNEKKEPHFDKDGTLWAKLKNA